MTTKDIETQQDDNNEEQTNTAPDADVEDNADETEDDVVDAMQKPLNTLLVSIVQSNLLKTYNETYQQNIPKREELPEEVKTALEPKVVEVTERIDALKEMPKGKAASQGYASVVNMFSGFVKMIKPDFVVSEKITKLGDNIKQIGGKIDAIKKGVTDKFHEVKSKVNTGMGYPIDVSGLDASVNDLSAKIDALNADETLMEDPAKYTIAFNKLMADFTKTLQGQKVEEKIVDTKVDDKTTTNSANVIAPVVATGTAATLTSGTSEQNTNVSPDMLNTADEKVKERLTKVTESYQAVQKRYTELGGKGGAEYKSLSLIDPKEKCAIIDPKTQTLFYFEKGVATKIVQVALGNGNDGGVSGVDKSHSTPPGTLTVISNKINIMSKGNRPSLLVDGLDANNKNTKEREILIHPTGVKGGKTVDKPTSEGCITMDKDLWPFFQENFKAGIMMQVIDDKFDQVDTKYFARNVQGKTFDMNAANQSSMAA